MQIPRILPLALAALTGCSFFNHSTQKLTVNTHPPGAEVYIDGQLIGPAPVSKDMKRGHDVNIAVKKEGFAGQDHLIRYHLSNTGLADVIGACSILLPAFGLLAPGAWSLNETEVMIRLLPSAP